MSDIIEKLGHSLIQHGPDSDRVYLMKLDPADGATIVGQLDQLAEVNDYGKIFCKVPAPFVEPFTQAGYRREAQVPKFFDGQTDVVFVSRFRKPERADVVDEQRGAIETALELAEAKRQSATDPGDDGYRIRRLDASDTPQLAALYRVVFPSYPFPIVEEVYLRETMATHIRYFGAFEGDRLVAAASAETDPEARNAEMTDFATEPSYRGRGLAVILLRAMESDMEAGGFATLYTIARAVSVGMNVTFARCGYHFGGTLVNNTQISGGIESMNVWYKNLT